MTLTHFIRSAAERIRGLCLRHETQPSSIAPHRLVPSSPPPRSFCTPISCGEEWCLLLEVRVAGSDPLVAVDRAAAAHEASGDVHVVPHGARVGHVRHRVVVPSHTQCGEHGEPTLVQVYMQMMRCGTYLARASIPSRVGAFLACLMAGVLSWSAPASNSSTLHQRSGVARVSQSAAA